MDCPQTVALIIGPYRNLTTLTAAALALHPECQVLNHGAPTVLADPRLDFLKNPSAEALEHFVNYALSKSAVAERGWGGGSIVSSHAFVSNPLLAELFRARFGTELKKHDVKVLVWKESLFVSQRLREHTEGIDKLLQLLPTVRFIVPIRNPLDCAVSNMIAGHFRLLAGLSPQATFGEVLKAVIAEQAWGLEMTLRYPNRFIDLFQFDPAKELFEKLRRFLSLPSDDRWAEDATRIFCPRRSYPQRPETLNLYGQLIAREFHTRPELHKRFLKFMDDVPPAST